MKIFQEDDGRLLLEKDGRYFELNQFAFLSGDWLLVSLNELDISGPEKVQDLQDLIDKISKSKDR